MNKHDIPLLRMPFVLGIALAAISYVLSGKLGLLLALPPGYVTLLWPPSGIAIGWVLIFGLRFWPGIWLGAFTVNLLVADAIWPLQPFDLTKTLIASLIATGSTLQAALAYKLTQRFGGLPLHFATGKHIARFLLFAGPLSCLCAATLGTTTLYVFGAIGLAGYPSQWLTWWIGDSLGVLVFLPLLLLLPWRRPLIHWRGGPINRLPLIGIFLIMLPIGLSLYAWRIVTANEEEEIVAQWEEMLKENESALTKRLLSYEYGLRGAAAFLQGSQHVTQSEWRNYIDTLNIEEGFPGAKGFGIILKVNPEERDALIKLQREEGTPSFAIHPDFDDAYYIITQLEPLKERAEIVGFNIASEANRRKAAQIARDTGDAVITPHISLKLGPKAYSGFLMLYPFYHAGQTVDSVESRRQAIRGWSYAPLLADDLFRNLTQTQGRLFHLRVYQGSELRPDKLIYSSNDESLKEMGRITRKTVTLLQQQWTLEWVATPALEPIERYSSAIFVLVAGMGFSVIFAVLFIVLALRQSTETISFLERRFWLAPGAAGMLILVGTAILFERLYSYEQEFLNKELENDARMLTQQLKHIVAENTEAIIRMGKRWDAADGTSADLWHEDAAAHIENMPIRALEWIDRNYYVRWVVPEAENRQLLDTNIAYTPQRRQMLIEAQSKAIYFTPPIALKQGYEAIITYIPVHRKGEFDGFIAALFDVKALIDYALEEMPESGLGIALEKEGKVFYTSQPTPLSTDDAYMGNLSLLGSEWTLKLHPTEQYFQRSFSYLPWVVLISGIISALLLASVIYSIIATKLANRRIAARKEQFRLLIQHTPAAVAMFDQQLNFITASDRWLSDYKLGIDIIGKNHYDVFPEIRNMPEWLDIHQRALSGEIFELREDSWLRDDGTVEWIEWAIYPWRNDFGEIGGVVMFTEVISARKHAEMALRTSEETLRLAIEHSPIGMALVGLDGRWLRVNEALVSMLGYNRDELIEMDFQRITHPDDLNTDITQMKQILSGFISSYSMEKRYIHKNGRIIWAMLHVSLVHDDAGKPHYFISQIADIDARKQAEEAQQSLIAKLAESNAELERFAYIASHDLREPARLISCYAELLQQEYGSRIDDMGQKYLGICLKTAQRMHGLITDLLDYARVGKATDKHAWFEVEEIVLYVKEMLGHSIDTRKAEITYGSLPRLHTDHTGFSLLLQNLILNGIKYCEPDITPRIHIEATKEDEGQYWIFSVQDNGIGINEEFAQQIFEPFKRLHTGEEYEGTGMGLAICRKIVDRLGGKIWVEPAPEKGSIFYFSVISTHTHFDA